MHLKLNMYELVHIVITYMSCLKNINQFAVHLFKKKPAKIKIILSIEFFNALMQIFKQCFVIRWKNYSLWNWNVLESNFDGLKENKKIPTQVIVMDFLKPGFYLFAYTAVLQSCFRIHMCTVEMLLWSYVYKYVVHVALPCYCNQK